MYDIIRKDERYHFENDWLSTYWHFSFDHYYDPDHVQFGPLRVFNDDIVQPASGFPTHGHREMEIVTYVIDGELRHEDSTGGSGIIGAGEVQRMSAGTGIRHSEFNASQEKAVHLLQMWVLPAVAALEPGYEQKRFGKAERRGALLPVVSGQDHGNALKIHQDAVFYVSSLGTGDEAALETQADRRVYLFVIEGEVETGGGVLLTRDTAKITGETSIPLKSRGESEVLVIDLP